MRKSNKVLFILFFLLLFAVTGYLREFFFVHMNNIMYMKYYHHDSPLAVPRSMKVFMNFSYDWLYYSKYVFTILWSALFFCLNYATLRILSDKSTGKLLVYGYLVLLVLAALSMLYGRLVNDHWNQEEYTLSRWLMGIAQSPLPCLILLAASSLRRMRQE